MRPATSGTTLGRRRGVTPRGLPRHRGEEMAPELTTSPALAADEVLATTRTVRSGLDLTRPVARELIEECVELALQAPSGSNIQNAHFVVATDAETWRALGAFRCSPQLHGQAHHAAMTGGLRNKRSAVRGPLRRSSRSVRSGSSGGVAQPSPHSWAQRSGELTPLDVPRSRTRRAARRPDSITVQMPCPGWVQCPAR